MIPGLGVGALLEGTTGGANVAGFGAVDGGIPVVPGVHALPGGVEGSGEADGGALEGGAAGGNGSAQTMSADSHTEIVCAGGGHVPG